MNIPNTDFLISHTHTPTHAYKLLYKHTRHDQTGCEKKKKSHFYHRIVHITEYAKANTLMQKRKRLFHHTNDLFRELSLKHICNPIV